MNPGNPGFFISYNFYIPNNYCYLCSDSLVFASEINKESGVIPELCLQL